MRLEVEVIQSGTYGRGVAGRNGVTKCEVHTAYRATTSNYNPLSLRDGSLRHEDASPKVVSDSRFYGHTWVCNDTESVT